MTNHIHLPWLVKTQSRDVHHNQMDHIHCRSALRGTAKWVPATGRWRSAAGKQVCRKVMAVYRRVDDLYSPAGWLPVHRDQLRAQRSVTSIGSLYLFPTALTNVRLLQNEKHKNYKQFGQSLYERPRRKEDGFSQGDNAMWHQSVRSIAVGCSSPAVMPSLKTEWSRLLRMLKQRLYRLENPQSCPSPWWDLDPHLTHASLDPWVRPQIALNRFSCFCTAHTYDQHTDRQTHRPQYLQHLQQ